MASTPKARKKKIPPISLGKAASVQNDKPTLNRSGTSRTTPKSAKRNSQTFFPSDGASIKMMEKKITDYELQIKGLKRENQVMAAKLSKMQGVSSRKSNVVEKEKEMRVAANKERFWLKQKLCKMQMAIEARLKMLGIDFSNCNDLGEALEAAFAAIQKLAAELAKKEAIISELEEDRNGLSQDQDSLQQVMDKLNNKLKKQQRQIDEQKKQIGDRDQRLSLLGKERKSAKGQTSDLENEIDRLRKEIESLKIDKEKQFDDFVDKKADMDSDLRKQTKANKKLKEELEKALAQLSDLKDLNNKLHSDLKKSREKADKLQGDLDDKYLEMKEKDADMNKMVDKLNNDLKLSSVKNAKLSKELDLLKDAYADLQKQVDQLQGENEQLSQELDKERQRALDEQEERKKSDAQNKKQVDSLEEKNNNLMEMLKKLKHQSQEQDEQIERYKKDLEESTERRRQNEQENERLRDQMDDLNEKMARTNDELKQSDEKSGEKSEEISKLQAKCEELAKQLDQSKREFEDYLKRERFNKATQTQLDSDWFTKNEHSVNNLAAIEKENETLRELAHKNDARLEQLVNENRELVDEIDFLLKQQAQFRPDSSNHRGEVLAMCASPNKYIVATTATDNTVRLWRCLPDEKTSKQVEVYACSRMDGRALSLAYTRDGAFLVAGCGYKNGPDGLLMVWNMQQNDGQVEYLFRSRASIRFGRAHCVGWSEDGTYILSGDTTGSIWVWDVQKKILLAEIMAFKDVVHDLCISKKWLFSCSLSHDVVSCDIGVLERIKIKKDKVHAHVPKKIKVCVQDKNDKYPYWVIKCTQQGEFIVGGSRKVMCWGFKEGAFVKGPRICDSDLDHIRSMDVKEGKLIICRANTAKAKVFDVPTGKEVKVGKFKQNVAKVVFTHTMKYAVCCIQSMKDKHAKPCKLMLLEL